MKQVDTDKSKKIIKISLYILCFFTACLLAFTVWQYESEKNKLLKQDQALAINITKNAAKKIGDFTRKWSETIDTIAQELTSGALEYSKISDRLQQKPIQMHGIGIAFSPHAYDKNKKLFAPYFVNIDKTQKIIFLENFVDYSDPTYQRFARTIQDGPTWLNPFWDIASKKLILEYAAPFYDKNHHPIGIVFGNYTIDSIQAFVASLYPSNFGYGEISTKNGTFISHPNYENIGQKKTMIDLARDSNNFKLVNNLKKAFLGELTLAEEDTNWLSGQSSWIIFEPIPYSNWYTLGVFVLSEFETKSQTLQRQFINIIMCLMALLFLLLLIGIRIYLPTSNKLWLSSISFAFALLIIIIFIWHILFTTSNNEPNKIIQNTFNIDKLIEQFNAYKPIPTNARFNAEEIAPEQNKKNDYILIPTGLYIHQISLGLDSITFNGYAWQQIPLSEIDKITPGIVFPQAREIHLKQAYKITKDDWVTIGWTVQGTLVQSFNFFNYPLDFKRIRIQLWPNSFDQKIILSPDFNGYKAFNPTSLPGINGKIHLLSWELSQSYFSYQKGNLLTNFGNHSPKSYMIDDNPHPIQIPELYFNIVANRYVFSALALILLPIIIILVLLFILMLMVGVVQFQFMFGSIASLFFTSLISYTSFKTYLPIQSVIFFDYIYFLLQGTILMIAIGSIMFNKKLKIAFIEHNNMLIPQLLFWPIVSSGVLFLSLIFFY